LTRILCMRASAVDCGKQPNWQHDVSAAVVGYRYLLLTAPPCAVNDRWTLM
jgi:hypothetical protein